MMFVGVYVSLHGWVVVAQTLGEWATSTVFNRFQWNLARIKCRCARGIFHVSQFMIWWVLCSWIHICDAGVGCGIQSPLLTVLVFFPKLHTHTDFMNLPVFKPPYPKKVWNYRTANWNIWNKNSSTEETLAWDLCFLSSESLGCIILPAKTGWPYHVKGCRVKIGQNFKHLILPNVF